jgi:hypothetical protein
LTLSISSLLVVVAAAVQPGTVVPLVAAVLVECGPTLQDYSLRFHRQPP